MTETKQEAIIYGVSRYKLRFLSALFLARSASMPSAPSAV